MGSTDPKKPPPKKRGPEPETLQIDGDWEERVKEALTRPPPLRKAPKKPKGREK